MAAARARGIGLNVSRRLLEQSARPLVALDDTTEPAAPGPGPHELADSAFAAARVREAISGLPAGQRHAVTLFYLAGLSQAEVAEHLGTAVGAVKTRLHKARASVDARPSDALNLALVAGALVLVDESVLERAASNEAELEPELAHALGSRRGANLIAEETRRARMAETTAAGTEAQPAAN